MTWISIHALRGEGDRQDGNTITMTGKFQSTPSVGRATPLRRLWECSNAISIHALRGEGDV